MPPGNQIAIQSELAPSRPSCYATLLYGHVTQYTAGRAFMKSGGRLALILRGPSDGKLQY